MGKINTRSFSLIVENELAKKISRATIRKAAEAAGREAVKQIQARTAAGIDYYGKRIPELSINYELRKRGGASLAKMLMGLKTTKWKARGTPNHGRLSGQLFSAMGYKIIRTVIKAKQIIIDIILDLKGDQMEKVKWLESNKGATRGWRGKSKTKKVYTKAQRFIWGLAKRGAWKTREQEAIKQAFREYFVKGSKIKIK